MEELPNRAARRYGPSKRFDDFLLIPEGTENESSGSRTEFIYALDSSGFRTPTEDERWEIVRQWIAHAWLESVFPHIQAFGMVPVEWTTEDLTQVKSGHIKLKIDISLLEEDDTVLNTATATGAVRQDNREGQTTKDFTPLRMPFNDPPNETRVTAASSTVGQTASDQINESEMIPIGGGYIPSSGFPDDNFAGEYAFSFGKDNPGVFPSVDGTARLLMVDGNTTLLDFMESTSGQGSFVRTIKPDTGGTPGAGEVFYTIGKGGFYDYTIFATLDDPAGETYRASLNPTGASTASLDLQTPITNINSGSNTFDIGPFSYASGAKMLNIEKMKIAWTYEIQDNLVESGGTITSPNTLPFVSLQAGVVWTPFSRFNRWRLTQA